jgi:cytochrome c556
MSKSKLLVGLSVVAGLAVVATGVQAQQDAIAKRKALMKEVGAASKLLNEMIKGEKPFDAKAAAEGMTKIAGGWAEFAKLYPKGTETGGETTASPKIWENFKDFDEKGQAMAAAAKRAADEAPKGLEAFKAAFGNGVGNSCRGCHEVYRIQKK